jgi:hypothetical protein
MARCVFCHQSTNKYKFKEREDIAFCDCNVHIGENLIKILISRQKKEEYIKNKKKLSKEIMPLFGNISNEKHDEKEKALQIILNNYKIKTNNKNTDSEIKTIKSKNSKIKIINI